MRWLLDSDFASFGKGNSALNQAPRQQEIQLTTAYCRRATPVAQLEAVDFYAFELLELRRVERVDLPERLHGQLGWPLLRLRPRHHYGARWAKCTRLDVERGEWKDQLHRCRGVGCPQEQGGHDYSETRSGQDGLLGSAPTPVEHRVKRRAGRGKRLLVRFNPLFCDAFFRAPIVQPSERFVGH